MTTQHRDLSTLFELIERHAQRASSYEDVASLAREERDYWIQQALNSGASVAQIARSSGLSRQAVMKIRSKSGSFSAQTYIQSPRHIASGRGAWQGTLAELFELSYESVQAVLATNHSVDDDVTLTEALKLLTLDDLREILDDPNILVKQ